MNETLGIAATGPNAAMIEHWNRVAGPGWVAAQEALDAHLAPISDLAIERADPQPGERVLDVGCGCGATTLALAKNVGPKGHVMGVDLSAPMLSRAGERVRAAGHAQVELVNADAQELALARDRDLVFSRFGVMFFRDTERAFANLRSALRPGGRMVFVCWRSFERNPWMGVPMAAAAPHLEVPLPPAPGGPGPFGLADEERLAGWLRGAGFEAPELESIDRELPVRGGAGLDEATDFVVSVGPLSRPLREAGDATRERVREAVREALVPFVRDGRVLLGASFWRVRARNPG